MVIRSNENRLRALLGESIAAGKTAADTMFSDDEISDFMELGGADNPDQIMVAAYWGWVEKAANYAKLVNVNEGNAARELSDLFTHARQQIAAYLPYLPTPGRGRARMGMITRQRD